MTRIDVEQCVSQVNNGLVMGSLGGLSGGPVFVWRKKPILTAELVGFVCEYQPKLDLMYIRLANVMREDGTFYLKPDKCASPTPAPKLLRWS